MADISSKSHLMFWFLPVSFLSCLIYMLYFDAMHSIFFFLLRCKCKSHILCVFQQRKKDFLVSCAKIKNPNIIMRFVLF